MYDQVFLLELRNNPASQILPEKLINEEITRGSPVKVFLIWFCFISFKVSLYHFLLSKFFHHLF